MTIIQTHTALTKISFSELQKRYFHNGSYSYCNQPHIKIFINGEEAKNILLMPYISGQKYHYISENGVHEIYSDDIFEYCIDIDEEFAKIAYHPFCEYFNLQTFYLNFCNKSPFSSGNHPNLEVYFCDKKLDSLTFDKISLFDCSFSDGSREVFDAHSSFFLVVFKKKNNHYLLIDEYAKISVIYLTELTDYYRFSDTTYQKHSLNIAQVVNNTKFLIQFNVYVHDSYKHIIEQVGGLLTQKIGKGEIDYKVQAFIC